MLARGPFGVDFPRALVDALAAPAHLLDDVPRISDEDLGVVAAVVEIVEYRRRAGDRRVEAFRIGVHAVSRAERTIALASKRRTRMNEREIDVEQYGADRTIAER